MPHLTCQLPLSQPSLLPPVFQRATCSSSPSDPVTVESPIFMGGRISTLATQRARSSSVSILSPSLPALQLTRHPKKEETPPSCLQTPSPKLCVTEVIILVSPVAVIRQSSSIINLVTPPPKSKCRLKVEPFSPKRDTSIELSLNVLSEQKSTAIDISLHPAPVHTCESGRFPSLDAAIIVVCDDKESLGHKWVKGQTKKTGGEVRRITMRCNHYRLPTEQHSVAIDPPNHHRGRSNKTDCKARVNII
jgi:hypothetical protein